MRKIVQIAFKPWTDVEGGFDEGCGKIETTSGAFMYVLCDDGTVWSCEHWDDESKPTSWTYICQSSDIPQVENFEDLVDGKLPQEKNA